MMNRKKKINPVGLLGLLGLLIFLWPITGWWPFVFTAGYFTFFKYLKILPDELFKENVRSSATKGFFLTQIIMGITMFSWAIFSEVLHLLDAFLILYWGNILAICLGFMVFAFKLSLLDKKELRDIQDIE